MKAIQLLQAHRAIHSISLKLFAPFLLGFTLSCNQRNLGHAAGEISQQSETEQELNSEFKMHIDHSCSFAGELSDNSVLAFSSDYEADNAVAKIMKLTGLSPNFVIKSSTVPNACAVIKLSPNGELIRYILYNQAFMERIKDETATNFAEMAVLAHEIGHHLNGHTLNNGTNRQDNELEADKFAGFILFKLNASIQEVKLAYSNLPNEASNTHPEKSARLAALSSGWYDAKRNGETQNINPGKEEEITNPVSSTSNSRNSSAVLKSSASNSSRSKSSSEIIKQMESYMNANLSSCAGKIKLSYDSRAQILGISSNKIPLGEVSISYKYDLKLDLITLQLNCPSNAYCIYNTTEGRYNSSGYGIILDHEDQYEILEKWINDLIR